MIIGTCSLCGGPVETPEAWLGTLPAPATCKNCGAVRPQHGPVIDMQQAERRSVPTADLGGVIEPKPATTGERYSWAYATPRAYSHCRCADSWWCRCRSAWSRIY